jgi:hypothetical protein
MGVQGGSKSELLQLVKLFLCLIKHHAMETYWGACAR